MDLLHQGAQVSLHARVLIQQIREAALPSPRGVTADRFEVGALRGCELLVCLSQPPLRHFGLPRVAAAQQPRELVPGRLPCISNRSGRYRLPGPLRQCDQNLTRHLLPPMLPTAQP